MNLGETIIYCGPFFNFWLHWVFVAACGLSLVAASGLLIAVASLCCRAWALGMRASVVVARGLSNCGSQVLEHRFSSCSTWA